MDLKSGMDIVSNRLSEVRRLITFRIENEILLILIIILGKKELTLGRISST